MATLDSLADNQFFIKYFDENKEGFIHPLSGEPLIEIDASKEDSEAEENKENVAKNAEIE